MDVIKKLKQLDDLQNSITCSKDLEYVLKQIIYPILDDCQDDDMRHIFGLVIRNNVENCVLQVLLNYEIDRGR